MAKLPSVDLDLVQSEFAGDVTLFGRSHAVHAVDAAQYQRIQNHDWSGGDLTPVIEIVGELVPSLTDEERMKCKLPVLVRITQIAMGLVAAVDQDLPNSSGPATTSPTPAESRGS
jgi:hypothetical protein